MLNPELGVVIVLMDGNALGIPPNLLAWLRDSIEGG